MSTPPLVLGYSKPTIAIPDISNIGGLMPQVRSSVHLTLFIHLEPLVAGHELHTDHLECSELSAIVVCIPNAE